MSWRNGGSQSRREQQHAFFFAFFLGSVCVFFWLSLFYDIISVLLAYSACVSTCVRVFICACVSWCYPDVQLQWAVKLSYCHNIVAHRACVCVCCSALPCGCFLSLSSHFIYKPTTTSQRKDTGHTWCWHIQWEQTRGSIVCSLIGSTMHSLCSLLHLSSGCPPPVICSRRGGSF